MEGNPFSRTFLAISNLSKQDLNSGTQITFDVQDTTIASAVSYFIPNTSVNITPISSLMYVAGVIGSGVSGIQYSPNITVNQSSSKITAPNFEITALSFTGNLNGTAESATMVYNENLDSNDSSTSILLAQVTDSDVHRYITTKRSPNITFNHSTSTFQTINEVLTGSLSVTGNTNLNNMTYIQDAEIQQLYVNGQANFVTIPTTVTASAGTSNEQIATTSFVNDAISSVAYKVQQVPISDSANYGILLTSSETLESPSTDIVYKNIGLSFNPSTKILTTPNIYINNLGSFSSIYTTNFEATNATITNATVTGATFTTIPKVNSSNIATEAFATNAVDSVKYKVQQQPVTDNFDFGILLTNSSTDLGANSYDITQKNTNLTFNPSTKTLKTYNGNFSGSVNVTKSVNITQSANITGSLNVTSVASFKSNVTISNLSVTGATVFSTIPTAPTADAGTSNSQVATTSFVTGAITNLSNNIAEEAVVEVKADQNIVKTYNDRAVLLNSFPYRAKRFYVKGNNSSLYIQVPKLTTSAIQLNGKVEIFSGYDANNPNFGDVFYNIYYNGGFASIRWFYDQYNNLLNSFQAAETEDYIYFIIPVSKYYTYGVDCYQTHRGGESGETDDMLPVTILSSPPADLPDASAWISLSKRTLFDFAATTSTVPVYSGQTN